jgi:hypothetical protein
VSIGDETRGRRGLSVHELECPLRRQVRSRFSADSVGRARRWLDSNVFPDPPTPPRITPQRAMIIAVVVVMAAAVQLARMSSSAPLNTLYAEDGATFLADATTRGFLDPLTTPYNGYLQTSSRLIASLVAKLPVHWWAAAMTIAGTVIVTGCLLLVWRASAGYIQSAYLRGTLAAMVILLPTVGVESLGNVVNSIWFLLFAAFWALLWRPATLLGAAGAASVLFLVAISNAGVLFLLPFWLLRLVAIRDRRDTIMVAGFAIGVAVQLGLSWGQTNRVGEEIGAPVSAATHILQHFAGLPHWHWTLLPAYLQRVVGGAVTGQRITGYLWVHLGTIFEVALGVVLIAFVAFALTSSDRGIRVLVPLTVAISLSMFLFEGYRRWALGGHTFLWPRGTANSASSHHMIVPTLLLLSALFMLIDVGLRHRSVTASTLLRTGVVLTVLLTALLSFDVGSRGWRGSVTWSQALNGARAKCLDRQVGSVHVITNGFPDPYGLSVACSRLNPRQGT